jgi:hypothetical protein
MKVVGRESLFVGEMDEHQRARAALLLAELSANDWRSFDELSDHFPSVTNDARSGRVRILLSSVGLTLECRFCFAAKTLLIERLIFHEGSTVE